MSDRAFGERIEPLRDHVNDRELKFKRAWDDCSSRMIEELTLGV